MNFESGNTLSKSESKAMLPKFQPFFMFLILLKTACTKMGQIGQYTNCMELDKFYTKFGLKLKC